MDEVMLYLSRMFETDLDSMSEEIFLSRFKMYQHDCELIGSIPAVPLSLAWYHQGEPPETCRDSRDWDAAWRFLKEIHAEYQQARKRKGLSPAAKLDEAKRIVQAIEDLIEDRGASRTLIREAIKDKQPVRFGIDMERAKERLADLDADIDRLKKEKREAERRAKQAAENG